METRRKAGLVLVLIVCLCAAVTAAPAPDRAQGLLDREAVLRAGRAVTNEAYPNADLVQVDEFTLCEYEPSGTGNTWSDTYTKVLTEKGRRAEQDVVLSYLLPYSQATVLRLELIKPDGSVVPVDIEKQSKVMINRGQMSANIYNPNYKVLQVGVPGVEIGDVLHLVTRREIMKRYMPGTWDDYQVFESMAPIKHAIYEVHAPKDRPLSRIALKDRVEGTVIHQVLERDGRIIYRWEVSDVPRIYAEPGMPPYHTVVQRLLVSTVPDWKAISSWYCQLCEPHLQATTPEMQAMVDRLTEGLTDRQKRIEAIFQWVSQQVRYMGITIEDQSPGWEPHDVKLTFESRHGVCRDKAALLVALLRLAGFAAYPVLIEAGPKKDAEVPVVQFNHAITAVRNDDGSYQLMDCTDETTKDLLPAYLCNCSYLIAHPQGATLQTSPIVPAEDNLVLIETTGELDARGNLTAETKLQFAGINDNVYRSYLARVKAEERRRLFEGVLKGSIATAQLIDFDLRPLDMQDTSESLSIRLRFTAEDVLIGDRDTRMMPVPHVATRVGMVNLIIGQTGLHRRRFPLQTQFACGVRENLTMKIDPAVGAFTSLPPFDPIEDATISWTRGFEQQADTLRSHSEFRINVVEFDPQQYLQLKEHLKQIEYNERKMPILSRQPVGEPPASDIVILDHRVEYDLTDAHNWTERHHVRKKILTYKGKKDNSELKLDYNPAWEQVKLVKVTVTNAGQVKEVSEQEINLMDAGWVASAPRYPAARTLVASLPAVEIGSVVEYEYERQKKDRPFFATTHVFRRFETIDHQIVKLTAPAGLALRTVRDDNGIAVPDESGAAPVVVESTRREGGEVVHQWEVRHQAPLKEEDALPPLHSFNPVLRITAGDWPTYAAPVLTALRAAAREQPTAAQRAQEITGQAKDDEQKIVAIRDFVAKNIRAAGPGCDDLPLDAVTPADRTLADGYGNTTDRAVLLYAMLQAVGCSPEFALVGYGTQVEQLKQFDMQYPIAHAFGSVLVRLPASPAPIYLNDTNQYAALGTTPADGHLALPLARGAPETIAVAPDKNDLRQYQYRITLTEEGDAHITVMRWSHGNSFAVRHRMYAEMPPEERHRFHQEMVAEIAQAAVADGNLVTTFDSYPGVESFSVRVDRYAVRDGDYLYFTLPRSLGHLFGLRSDTHEGPLYQGRDYDFRVSTIIELPQGFDTVVLAPEPKQWQLPNDGGTVRVTLSKQSHADGSPASLAITHEVQLNPFILDPQQYPDLLEIEKQLAHAEARTILVARRK